MEITTYLALTLLSVSVQFAVLGILQTSQTLKNETVDLNTTSPKKQFQDLIKALAKKPHAFYLRKKMNAVIDNKNNISTIIYTNSSLIDISLKTTTPSLIDDIFYDENISTTEDTFTSTEFSTELEYDNVTEITLFEKKNTSIVKPSVTLKKYAVKDCDCNLLYNVCDINCCCDTDCTEGQLSMFTCIDEPTERDVSCETSRKLTSFFMAGAENLFCVFESNLPEHRIIRNYKHDPSTLSKSLKWHAHANNREKTINFQKKYYKYGDPIWVLGNGSVYYIDLPSMVTSNHCTDRKPIKFLQDAQINCNVDLKHLEHIQILSTTDYASVISVTETSLNSSALNCTTLHCTNWTTVVCDENACVKYVKKLHEPICSDFICKNLALRVDYLFYYYDSKITNVTIKFYVRNVPLKDPFFSQHVNVKFLLANKSVDQIISLSGNPGYISGLPVIVSYAEGNFSESFYNSTGNIRYFPHQENTNGLCTTPSLDKKLFLFGINQQIKCRYTDLHRKVLKNATEICVNIQNNIKLLLLQSTKIVVCPFGNPRDIQDSEWITMSNINIESPVFGEINSQKTKLLCYNLLVRTSYIFTYADASEIEGKTRNRMLSAKVGTTERNVTFNVQDMSVVLTLDTVFIDESKPSVNQYAGGPQLNIHLPKDFFFPFPNDSNDSNICKFNVLVIMCACVLLLNSK